MLSPTAAPTSLEDNPVNSKKNRNLNININKINCCIGVGGSCPYVGASCPSACKGTSTSCCPMPLEIAGVEALPITLPFVICWSHV